MNEQQLQNRTRIQELEVENWNLKHQIGINVDVTMDSGEVRRATTRSKAQMLSGHSAVIWLEGISGCYLLNRVRAVEL
jgi:hypothetical protein